MSEEIEETEEIETITGPDGSVSVIIHAPPATGGGSAPVPQTEEES